MGNRHSGKGPVENVPSHRPHQERLEQLYEKLCNDEALNLSLFESHFQAPDNIVTMNLFNQFFIDLVNSASETKFLFVDRCHHILEKCGCTHKDQIHFFFDLIVNNSPEIKSEDLKKIIHGFCVFGIHEISIDGDDNDDKSCVACVQFDTSDKIISSIAETILNGKEGIQREDAVEWIQVNCPKVPSGLHTWLEYKVIGTTSKNKFDMLPQPTECSSSNFLLSPACLWYLCCILPSCYTYMENRFKTNDEDEGDVVKDVKFTWNLLYNSNQHGLSLNRFKNKVMEYKSPTVTLFEFSCGVILMLGLDEKWRDSPDKYGGHFCQLVELSPKVSIIEANEKMVYLKELGRSVPTGLLIGSESKPKLKISTDFNTAEILYKDLLYEQVERMEVWGCGGVEAMKSQEDIKKWEKKETEKRKKVKLPGQWDTDKSILEMGGVRVNHSERGDV